MPSSNLFDPKDVLTLYPQVYDWLVDLNVGDHGADGQN
jgi:hypothetical protein